MRPRPIAVAAALLLASTSVYLWSPGTAGATPGAPTAPRAPGDCSNQVNGAQCPTAGAGRDGRRLVAVAVAEGEVHGSGGGPECREGSTQPGQWVTYDQWLELNAPGASDPGAPPTEGAVYWVYYCIYRGGFEMGIDFDPWVEGEGWGGPGTPPAAGPTAADILAPMWVQVQGLLELPEPVLEPDEATRSKIEVPTFVAISNPQPATEYRTTFAGITVWITVDPTVTLNPGEPDAAGVTCDDDGTTYADGGARPRAQAEAEGACAHIYQHRTGFDGRPDAWAGDVTITWEVHWGSSEDPAIGDLAAVPSVTSFDRIVDEVQNVLTQAGE